MRNLLKRLAEEKMYGMVKVRDTEVLVRFYEHEGELVGAFWIPQEKTQDGIVFSAEIYRAVGPKDNIDDVVDDLFEHINSLLEKL
jgi:hypothetical protein